MERLTRRSKVGEGLPIKHMNLMHMDTTSEDALTEALDRLADFEDTGLTPEEIKNLVTINGNLVRANESLNHILSSYRDAEEQGLLHKAPIPDGTTIYHITDKDFMDFEKVIRSESYLHGYTEYAIGEINIDWFLTKEAAEEALKGGEWGMIRWLYISLLRVFNSVQSKYVWLPLSGLWKCEELGLSRGGSL